MLFRLKQLLNIMLLVFKLSSVYQNGPRLKNRRTKVSKLTLIPPWKSVQQQIVPTWGRLRNCQFFSADRLMLSDESFLNNLTNLFRFTTVPDFSVFKMTISVNLPPPSSYLFKRFMRNQFCKKQKPFFNLTFLGHLMEAHGDLLDFKIFRKNATFDKKLRNPP